MFLYQKLIDRSTLRQGFQIPVEFHHLLKAMPGGMPQHGETRNVKVLIDGVGYDAQLKNQDFETFEPREDKSAGIKQVTRLQKVRLLDRSIGDSLKLLYDYRCQMTGEKVGDEYNALAVEAHHIIPFTESMNNDTSNIIILSPSYHRIIHKANPSWDSKNLAFIFPNGLIEKVKIDKHLNI